MNKRPNSNSAKIQSEGRIFKVIVYFEQDVNSLCKKNVFREKFPL